MTEPKGLGASGLIAAVRRNIRTKFVESTAKLPAADRAKLATASASGAIEILRKARYERRAKRGDI